MSNLTEEQHYVQLQALPINDLQTLLTFAGQSRTGKRQELIDRCHASLKASMIIRGKCEELHNKRFGLGDKQTIPYPRDSTNTVRNTHLHLHANQQTNIDICFTPFTFNEDICVISPPHAIASSKQAVNGTQSLANFYFLLTAQQASDVATSTFFNTDQSKIEYRKQILLRFTTIGGDSTFNYTNAPDKLPPNLHVIVNSRAVLLPQPKPTAKPNSDVIRPGRPVDITEYCRLCPLISNLVEISWFTQDVSNPTPTYVAAVFLTERKTVPQLLARLSRPSAIRSSIETQRTVTQILAASQTSQGADNDLEVASTSLRLPLDCPAMRIRMRMPGRAVTCKHVHCFDLEGYLRMNEKKPTWLCPVCNKQALYTDLFVDQFFIDIIGKCSSDAKAIEYEPNGQWKAVGEEKLSRRAQRERDAYKAAQAANNTNGKAVPDVDHSGDDDSNDERSISKSNERSNTQDDIPIIELDDD
ncbi:unnamed protein product [Rotaria magnacalcarata]|uniref:Uncharacterized protein n=1 Tax=Rotaria magnacalcarata TaxID=392030 RepID=A0A815JKU9_9BILA|nr:unnamed protein product [Rotaria magnacalcarata]CAF1380372.1 unnamed protein product [Rotaria magnacalcarata]CAF2224064.1 unnamed protein product [Rotaria magnacalcarata]CAF3822679.1 unnamed protein product [Rotaria magnacalcarata]CAF3841173.1 unnamed protein product [Rotaria magnacalcarata]